LIARPLNILFIIQEENNWLDLLRQGDHGAMKLIFMRYHETLCRVAYRVIPKADKAKDIVQEVFLKLWIKREEIKITSSLEAYLKRAVVNTAINHLQQRENVPLEGKHMDSPLMISRDPSEEQVYRELSDHAEKAINDLPVRTSIVFKLIRLEGMTYREVSAHLDISEKAVEKEMMKALRLLREALKDYLIVLIYLKIFI
jgi:RNA polymerase sigma-70 factor, ECF subfamily